MTERLLQFIWQFQYFNTRQLITEQGEALTIIAAGKYNTNQGPDFLQAKIKIGETIWAGNVELHVNASDWNKHAHNGDNNYKNVILHVVWNNDQTPENSMPTLVLQDRVSSLLVEKYASLMQQQQALACAGSLHTIKEITWITWKDRLCVERMQRKAAVILDKLFPESNNHWEEVCWWLIARNFGVKVNADAFESIARSISINILAKHKSSIHQLEALLFGQAGLLENDFADSYPAMLKKEYAFLCKKYGLKRPVIQIHFLRMRPSSFPTVRLAQLAAFIHNSTHLFSQILQAEKAEELMPLFEITGNDYWHYHYRFDEESVYIPKKLGKDSIKNLLINAVIPLLFAYDNYHKQQIHKDKAIEWLQNLPVENNNVMKIFNDYGIKNKSGFDSQALLELKTQYCDLKKCLSCSIGNNLLKFAKN